MRKFAVFSIALCLFVAFVFSLSAAQDRGDSLIFSDSVYQVIESANQNNTVKIYNGTFMYLFGQRKSIEQIITDENLLESYYAVKGMFSSAEYYYIRD